MNQLELDKKHWSALREQTEKAKAGAAEKSDGADVKRIHLKTPLHCQDQTPQDALDLSLHLTSIFLQFSKFADGLQGKPRGKTVG